MTNNPYIDQIKQQGKDPVNNPAVIDGFPKIIHGRRFETKADYLEAIHDFLNGNWLMWDEIQDMPAEIFDMPETLDELIPEDEEKFDVEAHLRSNITFWKWQHLLTVKATATVGIQAMKIVRAIGMIISLPMIILIGWIANGLSHQIAGQQVTIAEPATIPPQTTP